METLIKEWGQVKAVQFKDVNTGKPVKVEVVDEGEVVTARTVDAQGAVVTDHWLPANTTLEDAVSYLLFDLGVITR